MTGEDALPVYEYIRLDLRSAGEIRERLAVFGRLAGDVNDEADVESRLYYAYYDRKDFIGGADVRLGRQWVNTVAGSPLLDGIRIGKEWEGLLKLTVFGGGHVVLSEDEGEDSVWGFSVKERSWAGGDLTASYLQKRDKSDLASEIFGASGRTGIARRGSVYGEFQYDLISRIYSYYLAGVRLVPGDRWSVKAEYLGYTPVFDSTSIYSVFAVDEYREISTSADYTLNRNWSLFGGYTLEMYESFEDSDVLEAGFEWKKKSGYGGYVAMVHRSGDEDLRGVRADLRIPAPYGIRVNIGGEYNVYNRIDDGEDDDTSAKRYWLGGSRDIGEQFALSAKVERIESIVYDYYNRGRFSLRYRF